MIKRALAGLLLAATISTAALAQATPPAASPPTATGRFAMQPVDGGVLRLDTDNGTLSMCKSRNGTWECQSMPDERAALDKEIQRLAKENEELKGAVKRLEELAGIPSDKPQTKRGCVGGGVSGLPGPEDVDKAMTYLQSMIKKFKEKLREFEDLDPDSRRKTERL
jgi:hypothetical protein